MLIIRLLVVLAAILMAGSLVVYLITGQVRFRRFTWQVAKALLVILLVFLSLLALERVFVPFL
ncbi:MAG: hypothetical protein RBS40_02780 [Rhodocyclaceae bacterium]|jgi:hypothetical protein|nr:hypothetical protein [Rhodocyclaceae bacterium]